MVIYGCKQKRGKRKMKSKVENLQVRVDNSKKKIEKLEQKIERIKIALNGGKNPYYYREDDLKWSLKDLEVAKRNLSKYEEALAIEINKEKAPKIKVLVDFLENWKKQATIYYRNECKRYIETYYQFEAEEKTITDWKERRLLEDQHYRTMQQMFTSNIRELVSFRSETSTNEKELEKMLSREVEAKYDDLVDRISKVTGEIKDCEQLHIGGNGSINGFVKGEKATAKVETIMAGGYNIQCLHYRVLVNRVK